MYGLWSVQMMRPQVVHRGVYSDGWCLRAALGENYFFLNWRSIRTAPWQKQPSGMVVVFFWREEEEERRPVRSSSNLRIAGLRVGSGVLALPPLPFSAFCAGALCGGGRIPMRSEVQAVALPRGGIFVYRYCQRCVTRRRAHKGLSKDSLPSAFVQLDQKGQVYTVRTKNVRTCTKK